MLIFISLLPFAIAFSIRISFINVNSYIVSEIKSNRGKEIFRKKNRGKEQYLLLYIPILVTAITTRKKKQTGKESNLVV